MNRPETSGQAVSGGRLNLTLQSFGHKHGSAPAADLVFDARPLPNPYWEAPLRHRHGLEPEVAAYVLRHPQGERFLALHLDLLRFYLQLEASRDQHREAITIAVGCTGGRHRSPAVTEALAEALSKALADTGLPVKITTRHRDIDKQ
ncbi:RapZ C-terminal domain-containing protein [Desulfurivibrio dismutans]|uniref:RapZ C-terminal domain-containing protein n=1 Tax=Desulfurivibrio dismutans TaxID=1398908 RepID=UPI0023DA14E4|nr:RNase adapter RapZ [Desulfurivibrio alkaliphilus]MDF1613831.1 RNase adapter RapZ [Desulfurivibrio alkaliphilus]